VSDDIHHINGTIPCFCGGGPGHCENECEQCSPCAQGSHKGKSGKKIKEQKIEDAADNLFDYVELSKRTLGLNWNKFSMEQGKESIELFETLLRSTYIDSITGYTNEKVNFAKRVPLTDTTVEVQSAVLTSSDQIPINYRVVKKDNEWRVYDVVIEGVSLISNYRTQSREILANNPPQVLIDTLRKKVGK